MLALSKIRFSGCSSITKNGIDCESLLFIVNYQISKPVSGLGKNAYPTIGEALLTSQVLLCPYIMVFA